MHLRSRSAKCPCVAVALGTQSGVFVFADWVMLDRDPCPVVGRTANDDSRHDGAPHDASCRTFLSRGRCRRHKMNCRRSEQLGRFTPGKAGFPPLDESARARSPKPRSQRRFATLVSSRRPPDGIAQHRSEFDVCATGMVLTCMVMQLQMTTRSAGDSWFDNGRKNIALKGVD